MYINCGIKQIVRQGVAKHIKISEGAVRRSADTLASEVLSSAGKSYHYKYVWVVNTMLHRWFSCCARSRDRSWRRRVSTCLVVAATHEDFVFRTLLLRYLLHCVLTDSHWRLGAAETIQHNLVKRQLVSVINCITCPLRPSSHLNSVFVSTTVSGFTCIWLWVRYYLWWP